MLPGPRHRDRAGGPLIGLAIALWPVFRLRFAHPDGEVKATVSLEEGLELVREGVALGETTHWSIFRSATWIDLAWALLAELGAG